MLTQCYSKLTGNKNKKDKRCLVLGVSYFSWFKNMKSLWLDTSGEKGGAFFF